MQPHRGALILVLGILGLVMCFPLGIAAWIMGNGDLRQIDLGRMDPSGRSVTEAGKILGIIATVLGVLSLLGAFIALLFAVLAGAFH